MNYNEFFKTATGHEPYPFQVKLAAEWQSTDLVDVPTGLGKTYGAVCAWLWHIYQGKATKRLAYALPMRGLTEQVHKAVGDCLERLQTVFAKQGCTLPKVYMMMGGAKDCSWERTPEEPVILVGTMDMLLSRALNRPYGTSIHKARVHFGLLNTDVTWVCDETQLMEDGLRTTSQLQGLREKMGTGELLPTKTLWLSATLSETNLHTVDLQRELTKISLSPEDYENPRVAKRANAVKTLRVTDFQMPVKAGVGVLRSLAQEVLAKHEPGTLTIVYLNRWVKAQDVYLQMLKDMRKSKETLLLVHAKFRGAERDAQRVALEEIQKTGGVLVTNQALEAGVDISAKRVFSELAPWSSLVQRFGRCNREGQIDGAEVFLIQFQNVEKTALPYDAEDLVEALELYLSMTSGSPKTLNEASINCRPMRHPHTLRRRDLVELFDTNPDLSGNTLDIAQFIRTTEDLDVFVYWRDFIGEPSEEDMPFPSRKEMCPIPLAHAKEIVKCWRRLQGEDEFEENPSDILPGDTLLLHSSSGQYQADIGWLPNSTQRVEPIALESSEESFSPGGESTAVSLNGHTHNVVREGKRILDFLPALPLPWKRAILQALLYHDIGKAHPIQQFRYQAKEGEILAKPNGKFIPHPTRTMLRHELASALMYLELKQDPDSDWLVPWLIATHHGQIGLALYPRHTEARYAAGRPQLFALGVWDGDTIPGMSFMGETVPEFKVDLHSGLLGLGERGWREHMVDLRDKYGIFVLAYLEAIVRAADWEASRKEKLDE